MKGDILATAAQSN